MESVQDWVLHHTVCPIDRDPLRRPVADTLSCSHGHSFRVVQGVPVLLTESPNPTHPYCASSLKEVRGETVSVGDNAPATDAVDPFVQDEIVKTNGILYRSLQGRLKRYPIPELRLPPGNGSTLLDVGSNWGRWTIAASRLGYRAVGIDPSLQACLAAGRVARQLGVDAGFVVGDARCLPFADQTFDCVYSYSVLQHFSKEDARSAITEIGRTTRAGGASLVQLPNILGIRQFLNYLRRQIARDRGIFRVRYWTPWEIRSTFQRLVGPTVLSVDGFLSLNPQPADLDMLAPFPAFVVRLSEALRATARAVPPLTLLADSLYAQSVNDPTRRAAARG